MNIQMRWNEFDYRSRTDLSGKIPQGTTLPNVRDMKQFAEVYDTQIYSWTNQPQPQLNGVGPAAEKVHSVYSNIIQVLWD